MNTGFLMDTAAVVDKEISPERQIVFIEWVKRAVVVGLIVALYAKVIADLGLEWWTVPSSSYGILIPPVALYIAHMRRKIIFAIPAHPDLHGLWLIGLACLLLMGGNLAAEFYLSRISIVPLAAGLAWTFWGRGRLNALVFPLTLLATMVPLPVLIYNLIAVPLQLFATGAATVAAQAAGVSIYRQGNVIQLASTSLGVAEACSGLQSLSALLVASLIVGFVENASVLGRVLLFLMAPPLAILVNVLRIAGTAILADYRLQFALGFYHSFSGWLVFVIGFGSLWLLGKIIFRLTRGNLCASIR
jgi:exosortase